jgi:hypothetical protein
MIIASVMVILTYPGRAIGCGIVPFFSGKQKQQAKSGLAHLHELAQSLRANEREF